MRSPLIALAGAALVAAAPPADWTPHSAAALLDASFPSADACRRALATARARETRARPVHGLSYQQLFANGRCRSVQPHGQGEWRIRMIWPARR